jgi:serine/threonine-protein kinase RsbW
MKTELLIPSDLKFLEVVETWVLNSLKVELEDIEWEKISTRIRLVLVEAFSNVVRHAHKETPHLPVLLSLEIKDNHHLCLQIWDYGQGYDVSNYPEPDPETKPLGGFGWLIINRLMDKVEYDLQVDGRNCLTLEIHLPKL